MQYEIIAAGRMRDKNQLALWQDYAKRLSHTPKLIEIEIRKPNEIDKLIAEKLDPQAFIFILDERGKSLGSVEFAKKLSNITMDGIGKVQFVLGGADGFSDDLRKKANFLLSFGKQTWPHMLARIMLIEQIYRAVQIQAGHPYHRE